MIARGSLFIVCVLYREFTDNITMEQKKEEKPFSFSSLVAGVGFEPHDLRVMSPTSYRLLYPAILDCKYTDYFLICKFLLQKV